MTLDFKFQLLPWAKGSGRAARRELKVRKLHRYEHRNVNGNKM
jgi:hypothetical protein